MDLFLALLTFGFVLYFLVWKDMIAPHLPAASVKRSPAGRVPRLRSRRSRRSNAANAGSSHTGTAGYVPNVPPNVPPNAPALATAADLQTPASTPEVLTLTPRELAQLAEALTVRAKGGTVEEAIKAGFGASKGGGPTYRRARELFDAATRAP